MEDCSMYQHFTFIQEYSNWTVCQGPTVFWFITLVWSFSFSLLKAVSCQCCVLSHLWCRSPLIWWQVTQQLSGITPRAQRERGEQNNLSQSQSFDYLRPLENRICIGWGGAINWIYSFYWEEATCNLHDHVIKHCVTLYHWNLPSSQAWHRAAHSDTHHSFLM